MLDRKEYMRLYHKKYYLRNKEIELKKIKEWQKNNKEHLREYHREYYVKNKEKLLKRSQEQRREKARYDKEYRKKHKERYLELSRIWFKTEKGKATSQRAYSKRRATIGGIINTLTLQEWLDILEEHNYRCAYCGCEFEIENMPTKDHIFPISRGGNNTKENVVPACSRCNLKKHNKVLIGGIYAIH